MECRRGYLLNLDNRSQMEFLDLLCVASMPVLKVLLVTALGSFLALDHIDIFGDVARKQVNRIVFYVFNPALVSSNLASTVSFESIIFLWFMPFNILVTFVLGSALGWLLVKITKTPQNLKGLVLGSCAAGNLGNMPLIIIPAMCKEKGSPFGDPDVCYKYGMSYASLSMAIGAIFLWSYVYNIMRVSSSNLADETSDTLLGDHRETLLSPENYSCLEDECKVKLSCHEFQLKTKVSISDKIKQHLWMFSRQINLKRLFAPSTVGAIAGFMIGLVPPLQKLMIGNSAPLRVVQDSALLIGDAAIPTVTLIIGANLLKGLRGSGIRISLVVGIIAVRYVVLPLLGIIVVKSAVHLGFVHSDPLYQFVLLLQFALPPAMNIATITQLFGAGESECSVILLWTYALASVALTLWSTFFMTLVVA